MFKGLNLDHLQINAVKDKEEVYNEEREEDEDVKVMGKKKNKVGVPRSKGADKHTAQTSNEHLHEDKDCPGHAQHLTSNHEQIRQHRQLQNLSKATASLSLNGKSKKNGVMPSISSRILSSNIMYPQNTKPTSMNVSTLPLIA